MYVHALHFPLPLPIQVIYTRVTKHFLDIKHLCPINNVPKKACPTLTLGFGQSQQLVVETVFLNQLVVQ